MKQENEKFDWSSQGHIVLGGILLLAIILYAIVGSSQRRTDKYNAAQPKTVEYGGEVLPKEKFNGLEATRKEKNPELIGEIKKVIKENGTPADIFAEDVPPDNNIATELDRAFRIYDENPGEIETLRAGVSYGDWKIDSATLQDVKDILTRTDTKRLNIRKMLERSSVCFSFEFVESETGTAPVTKAADYLADYMLLEEFAVAQALQDGAVGKAAEALAYIFRIAQLAAEVRSPGTRTKAAQIRLHAVDVLQAVLLHPKLQKSDVQFLYEMMKEQLDHWTPDSEMWVGDRASGLKVYNEIMQYGLDKALEEDEIAELYERGIYDTVNKGLLKKLSADEVFYLQAMRTVIDESEKPFYKRLTALNQMEDQLRAKWGTDSEPVIAGFLLRGITDLMEYCALDRTKCETAVSAMQVALGQPAAFKIEPLYGKEYTIKTDDGGGTVSVSYPNNPKPFTVRLTH
ncbi:MAG: hypothetical protein LBN39_03150 [Planctomycetaceae bacterium]|jgi:hypothetical protein|nr:hypothetical protein [Planctomycetaceae bacterium]